MKKDFYQKKPSRNFRTHKCNDITKIVPNANQKVVLRKFSCPECTICNIHDYELSIVYCIVMLLSMYVSKYILHGVSYNVLNICKIIVMHDWGQLPQI